MAPYPISLSSFLGSKPTADRWEELQSRLLQRLEDWDAFYLRDFFQFEVRNFHSPFLLPDITPAVETLISHTESNGKILLFGDRDTDGVSSTCLLGKFLRHLQKDMDFELVIRTSSKDEDYGLCPPAVKFIQKEKPNLLITLDFGTSNFTEINALASEGVDVIVLDHHEIPERIPQCHLINPRRIDSLYPEKKICTSFLALKFVQAILFRKSSEFNKIYKIPSPNTEPTILESQPFPKFFYYQKGCFVGEFSELEASQNFPNLEPPILFNPSSISQPQKWDREIFFFQCKSIPNFFESTKRELDLASIGTIADMMPLWGENRILVKKGCDYLARIVQGEEPEARPGMVALLKESNLSSKKVTAKDLGWTLAPILNAAGRMNQTELACQLLLSETESEALLLAKKVSDLNLERRERNQRNFFRVETYFQRHPHKLQEAVVFCYEPDMEPGVSGIVATKMVEKYGKSAIFINPDHGKAKGSVRSTGKENVLSLLHLVKDHLIHYGGHPEAAGFSIEIQNIPILEKAIYENTQKWLANEKDQPQVKAKTPDLICNPEDIGKNLFQFLERFEPTGQGNPPILISVPRAKVLGYTELSGGKHCKFSLQGGPSSFKVLLWNRGKEFFDLLSQTTEIDLVGSLEENYFRDKLSYQMVLQDFYPSSQIFE